MGYNVPYTRMEIRNIQNSAIVQAQRAVADPALDSREDVTFSYAGGIAGIVTQKMVIDNCRNVENGKVLAKGYYTGGLAEVNLGTIRNCGNIGSLSGSDHIGSVAGLNKGTVQKCTLTGQVTGGSDVGGLVAYNDEEGLILDSGVSYKGQDSAVRGTGKKCGRCRRAEPGDDHGLLHPQLCRRIRNRRKHRGNHRTESAGRPHLSDCGLCGR